MTPSQYIKSKGLDSLVQVTALTGVSPQTLANWYKNKPLLFEVLILGCVGSINTKLT